MFLTSVILCTSVEYVEQSTGVWQTSFSTNETTVERNLTLETKKFAEIIVRLVEFSYYLKNNFSNMYQIFPYLINQLNN